MENSDFIFKNYKEQILALNYLIDKYECNDEVKIVSPFVDFRDIPLNTPSIILNNLNSIL